MNLILPKRFGQDKPPVGAQIKWGHPLAQGLVGCWLFNEAAGGRAHDLSGRGNHGTLTEMAIPPTPDSGWNPGRTGIGLKFDNVNDYVNCGNNASLNAGINDWSIGQWIKTGSSKEGNILAKGNGYRIKITSENKIWVTIEGNDRLQNPMFIYGDGTHLYITDTNNHRIVKRLASDLSFVDKVNSFASSLYSSILNAGFHHIQVNIKNYDILELYIDGNSDSSTDISYKYHNYVSEESFKIGGYINFFNSLIDEVCIYNRALLPQEVRSLYEAPYQFIIPQ